MKKLFLAIISAAFIWNAQADAAYSFEIIPDGIFWTEGFGISDAVFFEFDINKKYQTPSSFPNVIDEPFGVRRNYSFENPEGICTAIARFVSLGSIFECLKEIDVYQDDCFFGSIEGYWNTVNSAKFLINNSDYNPFAIAYYNPSCTSLIIVDYNNPEIEIATFKKHIKEFLYSVEYDWHVEVHREDLIDYRFIAMLSAYMADVHFEQRIMANNPAPIIKD